MMKLSKKDFNIFKNECEKWIKIFGLINWKIDYKFEKLIDGYAECHSSQGDRRASLILCSEMEESDYKYLNIKLTAFHEVMELLLSPLVACAETRYLCEHEINEADHDIIRRLENVVFKQLT